MKIALLWLAAPAVVLALILGGCSKGSDTASGGDVVAPEAPPAAQSEMQQPPAPGPDFVWIQGYWVWGGQAYAWHPGYWERPPQTGYVWVAPRYEHVGRGYRFQAGRWSVSVGGVTVEGHGSRPEERREARPEERREARPAERPAERPKPEERERR
jgi:hypothetical protein